MGRRKQTLYGADLNRPLALVLGAEGARDAAFDP